MEAVAGLPPDAGLGGLHGPHLRPGLAAAGRAARRSARCWPGWPRIWPTARSASACCSATRPRPDPAEYLARGRAGGRGGRADVHPRARPHRDGARHAWSTAPRRSSGRRRRPARTCTTATSTAPRGGTSTGCSALVGPCQADGSRVTTEAYPYGSGMTGDRRRVPGAGAARRAGPVAVLAHLRADRRAGGRRRPGCASCAPTDPGGLVIIDLLNEDDPADRRC